MCLCYVALGLNALARCSEPLTKHVTPACPKGGPGAWNEHVTAPGQTLAQRQGRWLPLATGEL